METYSLIKGSIFNMMMQISPYPILSCQDCSKTVIVIVSLVVFSKEKGTYLNCTALTIDIVAWQFSPFNSSPVHGILEIKIFYYLHITTNLHYEGNI